MNTLFAITTLVALTASPAAETEVIKLTMPKEAKINKAVAGTVSVTIPEGWHAYQNPPTDTYQNPITITSKDKNVVLKSIKYPKGVMHESQGTKAAVYEGTVKIPISAVFKKAGKQNVKFTVLYQQCNESTCMPPKFVVVQATVNVK